MSEDEEDLVGEEADTGIADAPIDHPSNLPGVMSGENEPGNMPLEIVNIKDSKHATSDETTIKVKYYIEIWY